MQTGSNPRDGRAGSESAQATETKTSIDRTMAVIRIILEYLSSVSDELERSYYMRYHMSSIFTGFIGEILQ